MVSAFNGTPAACARTPSQNSSKSAGFSTLLTYASGEGLTGTVPSSTRIGRIVWLVGWRVKPARLRYDAPTFKADRPWQRGAAHGGRRQVAEDHARRALQVRGDGRLGERPVGAAHRPHRGHSQDVLPRPAGRQDSHRVRGGAGRPPPDLDQARGQPCPRPGRAR